MSGRRGSTGVLLAAGLTIAAWAGPAAAPAAAQDTLRVGSVVLHYWPAQAELAARLAGVARAQTALPGLPPDVLAGEDVDVFIAPDVATWDRLTGGRVPEWGAGVADPAAGVIVLAAFDWARRPPHGLPATLRHELAHVALQRWAGASRVPRWFTEGYAQWAAGEWDAAAGWRLRAAFALNRAPPLDSLTLDWPVGEAEARLAYLLAASAVGYLAESGGARGMRLFFERWRRSGDFEQALRRTYGVTVGQFEEDWRKTVRRRYAWPLLLGYSVAFWLIAAAVLIVLFAIRRRRDRARLARLEETEPPDEPAFWEEGW